MPSPTLMYHDVAPAERSDEVIVVGPGADLYTLQHEAFQEHLITLAEESAAPVSHEDAEGWMLTFDDGGAGSLAVAKTLAERGWIGHFFIPTALIGTRGFVTEDDLRAIAALGHVIGSHSHTHAVPFSALDAGALAEEWRASSSILSHLLDTPITAASVPGGYTSRAVEAAAAAAGIRTLFTSQPTVRTRLVASCVVRGRYTIKASTGADAAAALVTGRGFERRRQSAVWAAKSVPKRVLGQRYPRIRSVLLARGRR